MLKKNNECHHVPYFSQKTSFLRQEGLLTHQQIYRWKNKLCGLLCAYMVLANFDKKEHTLAKFLALAEKESAYDVNKGWIHEKIIRLLQKYGINGECLTVNSSRLVINLIEQSKLIIASVSPYYLGNGSRFRLFRKKTGHLVLIIGTVKSEKGEYNFVIHDPGSVESEGGESIMISEKLFNTKFSGNIMVFERPKR